MTEAEADLVASRVLAAIEPRLASVESAVRLGHRSQVAGTKAVVEMHRQMVVDAAVESTRHGERSRLDGEVRDALRALAPVSLPPGPDPEPDPVEDAVVDLKVQVIRGISALPSKVGSYLTADPVRTAALTLAVGGFAIDILTGSPLVTALLRAITSYLGQTTSTGSAP